MATETADLAATVVELRRLLGKATRGPWEAARSVSDGGFGDGCAYIYGPDGDGIVLCVGNLCYEALRIGGDPVKDVAAVAALWNAAPALLDAVSALTAEWGAEVPATDELGLLYAEQAAELARMRPVFDAALLLAMTPTTHPLYQERKDGSWALAFDEARKRGVQCDLPVKDGGDDN